jgi:subtilisin family serine protease
MLAADAPSARLPLDVVSLSRLMERTAGRPEVAIGLIDGPVAADHADLAIENVRSLSSLEAGPSNRVTGAARAHGTYVAGILSARRGSAAPAICPDCTLLVRPIFLEPAAATADTPSASPEELADAIVECVAAGARILNLSVALATPSPNREPRLEQALDHAAARGTVVVAAAGNQATLGTSAITRHPAVLPVVACDHRGRPAGGSNLAASIGRRGLMAPGEEIVSLQADGGTTGMSGTSAAVPFVTGTIALLCSLFHSVPVAMVRAAVSGGLGPRSSSVVPPLLNAEQAYAVLAQRGPPTWRAEGAAARPAPGCWSCAQASLATRAPR